MSIAVAIVDRLYRVGLTEHGLPGWWRTPRAELDGRSPRQALERSPDAVLKLAEVDALAFARTGVVPVDEADPRRPGAMLVRDHDGAELRIRGDYVARTTSGTLMRTWTVRTTAGSDRHPVAADASIERLLETTSSLGWPLADDQVDELFAQLRADVADLRDAIVEAALTPRSIEHVSACGSWSTATAVEQVGQLAADAGHLVDLCDAHNALCADISRLLEAAGAAMAAAEAHA